MLLVKLLKYTEICFFFLFFLNRVFCKCILNTLNWGLNWVKLLLTLYANFTLGIGYLESFMCFFKFEIVLQKCKSLSY